MTAPRPSLSRQSDAINRLIDAVEMRGARHFGMRESEFAQTISDARMGCKTINLVRANETEIRALIEAKKGAAR